MAACLVILFFASVFASPSQNNSTAQINSPAQTNSLGAPGCGPANVKLDVKSDHNRHVAPTVEPGKALIVFLQDDAKFESRPRPTTRFGIDGTWVGATQGDSYFYALVDAGERHVCANWQSWVGIGVLRSTAAMHFTAEVGRTYYIRAQDIAISESGASAHYISGPEVVLDLVDGDEAQLLMSSFGFSSSHPRK